MLPGDDGGTCQADFGLVKQSAQHGNKIVALDVSGDGVGSGADIVITGTKQGKATLGIRLKDYPDENNTFPVTIGPPPI